jgi:hypothetical protein
VRLRLEQLEDRTLPSNFFAATTADLIADINTANSAGGINTITLTAPTTSPYVLSAVNNSTDGPTGLPVITGGNAKQADNLTIVGNGDAIERSTASGTPAFRLLDVASGGSLTLQNLTLQNGLAFGSGSSAEGGAIYNQGTLVLSAVTVQGNVAQGSDGVSNSGTGDNGNACAGGGIWSNGSLTLQNGTIVQTNQAIGGGPGGTAKKSGTGGNAFGGGVYVAGGTANFTGVSITNNIALAGLGAHFCSSPGSICTKDGNAFGGGLYVEGGTVTLSSDTLDGNKANAVPLFTEFGGSAFGGALYVQAGTVTLTGDMVGSNVATGEYSQVAEGGGIYIASEATVTLCNDTVESNTADDTGGGMNIGVRSYGGGIYIASGATVYIDSFTVAHTINNTAFAAPNIDGTYILQSC